MAEDLPIYSQSPLRSGRQFADLERLRRVDAQPDWAEADRRVALMEGAADVSGARAVLEDLASAQTLCTAHALLFAGRDGAGATRTSLLKPRFRGQDYPPPEFIERSIGNLLLWLDAESFREIHPIEQAALALTRLIDIWPFESGNLTVAVVVANRFLTRYGLEPFFVRPEHLREFDAVLAQAITMDTQPLVNAIYRTVRQQMESRGTPHAD